jgi:hypothetical protein
MRLRRKLQILFVIPLVHIVPLGSIAAVFNTLLV